MELIRLGRRILNLTFMVESEFAEAPSDDVRFVMASGVEGWALGEEGRALRERLETFLGGPSATPGRGRVNRRPDDGESKRPRRRNPRPPKE